MTAPTPDQRVVASERLYPGDVVEIGDKWVRVLVTRPVRDVIQVFGCAQPVGPLRQFPLPRGTLWNVRGEAAS